MTWVFVEGTRVFSRNSGEATVPNGTRHIKGFPFFGGKTLFSFRLRKEAQHVQQKLGGVEAILCVCLEISTRCLACYNEDIVDDCIHGMPSWLENGSPLQYVFRMFFGLAPLRSHQHSQRCLY